MSAQGETQLYGDVNGDGLEDFRIDVAYSGLGAADFVL